jgi:hypothetical protein
VPDSAAGDGLGRDGTRPDGPGPIKAAAGMYHECWAADQACLDEAQVIREAGFSYTVNSESLSQQNLSTITAYATKLTSLGMKTFWEMTKDPFPTAAAQYVLDRVNAVKSSPATAGYFVGSQDGMPPERVEWLAATVKSADPDPSHLTLYIHFYQMPDCTVMLRPYASKNIDVVGLEMFPLAHSRPLSDVATCSQAGQQYASSVGKKWAVLLQAFDGSAYGLGGKYPTRIELQTVRDQVLNNSQPVAVIWWKYSDSRTPANRWNDLVQVATGTGPP